MEFEEEENHVSMEELESEVIANDDEDEFEYKGIEIEDDDEEEELEEEMMLPRVSCWYGADGKKYLSSLWAYIWFLMYKEMASSNFFLQVPAMRQPMYTQGCYTSLSRCSSKGARQIALKRRSEDLKEKLNYKTDDAEQHFLAMELELDALQQRYDVLLRRAAVLNQRTNEFKQRYNSYQPRLKFFKDTYKYYLGQEKKYYLEQEKKKKMTTIMRQHNVPSD